MAKIVDLGTDSVVTTDLVVGFPAGWPPRHPTGFRSIRVYKTGTATTLFSDTAFLFSALVSADTFTPLPYVAPGGERTNVVVDVNPWGSGTNNHDANPDPLVSDAPPPTAMIWCHGLVIHNTHATVAIEFSFDAINVHGYVPPLTTKTYNHRFEAGIALRGVGGSPTFRLEAW